jgi:hypothetical protein
VNVFGAPPSFNPLGEGGTVGLYEGGGRRFDKEWKWTHSFAGGEKRDYTASMHSVLKVGTPATAAATEAAREGLRQAVERAKGPCLHLALSLGVIATGAVWTSVSATVPGGIPAGGAIIATGDLMASATAPLCAPLIKDVIVYYSLLVKDPPLAKSGPVLRLSSCEKRKGKLRTYCEQLSAGLQRLVRAENGVLAAATQLQAGIATLAAARKSRNTKATADAEGKVRSQTAALVAARKAAAAAGAQVSRIVTAVGVRGRLTKAQSAATIRALLANLAKQGVPSTKLRALLPAGALTAKPTDFLATLRA